MRGETCTNMGAESYSVGVRPEHLRLGDDGIPGEVTVVEELGSEAFLHVNVAGDAAMSSPLVVRAPGETPIKRGDQVSVSFDGPTHVFDAEGNRLGD